MRTRLILGRDIPICECGDCRACRLREHMRLRRVEEKAINRQARVMLARERRSQFARGIYRYELARACTLAEQLRYRAKSTRGAE